MTKRFSAENSGFGLKATSSPSSVTHTHARRTLTNPSVQVDYISPFRQEQYITTEEKSRRVGEERQREREKEAGTEEKKM